MLAQVMAVLAAPLLTRLYSPSEFGTFAIINAASLIFAAGMALRLEFAVPIPAKGAEAQQIVHLAVQSILLLGTLSLAAALAFTDRLAGILRIDTHAAAVVAIPIMAATYAFFNLFNAVAVRGSRYRAIARRQIVVALGMVILQLAAGLIGAGVAGLVIATTVAQLIGAMTLAIGSGLNRYHRDSTSRQSRTTLRSYWRFPVFLAPAGWINTASNHGQVIALGILFSPVAAGWFGLVVRVVSLPMTLLGQGVAQVYLSELASGRRNETGTEWRLFVRTSKMLLLAAIPLGIALAAAGPWAFSFVFGEQWTASGEMARAFSLCAATQLVASPLSLTLVVYGRVGAQLALDVTRLVVAIGALGLAHYLNAGPEEAVWALSIGLAGVNALNWELCRRTVRTASRPH